MNSRTRHSAAVAWAAVLIVQIGCASLTGMQERYIVCSYDDAWDAAVESVKDRSIKAQDKSGGKIETAWLEIPMPGRTFGAFQRDMPESKDRSRIMMSVSRLNDVVRVSYSEERQRWAFRGGSRMFGWADADPSAEVLTDVQRRLDTKLKERGCVIN